MITEIMYFNRSLWWLPWHRQLVLVFGILTSNEECHFWCNTICFGANVYMCYDYVHLDNLLDISAY